MDHAGEGSKRGGPGVRRSTIGGIWDRKEDDDCYSAEKQLGDPITKIKSPKSVARWEVNLEVE